MVLTGSVTRRGAGSEGRAPEEQDGVDEFVVDRMPVCAEAVLPELLAVVGGNHHEGAVEHSGERSRPKRVSILLSLCAISAS